MRIASAVLHCGEEPPLTGDNGSGTIFISGCNLGCVFCQNYQISKGDAGKPISNTELTVNTSLGKEVSEEGFADICKALRDRGAANINIVTGSHAVPAIIQGITAAKNAGVELPFLWNSSGYESTETLELLRDYIDIYLPDLKTLDTDIAAKFFNAPDYPQAAAAAVLKMAEMADENPRKKVNINKRLIVRHLVLPGYLENTRQVLLWFAENCKDRALLSLMTQYTPIPGMAKTAPDRYLSETEYETVMCYLEEFGIEDGFCQELKSDSDWLPDFKRFNPFPSKLSKPVWHF